MISNLTFIMRLSTLFNKINDFVLTNTHLRLYLNFVKFCYPLLLFKFIDPKIYFGFYKNLYKVSYNKRSSYYYNIYRSPRYCSGGFLGAGKYLYKKYLLNNVPINKNDIVIDVGANIGELSVYLAQFNPYIYAFDIEQKALDCLKLNLKNYKKKYSKTCYLER